MSTQLFRVFGVSLALHAAIVIGLSSMVVYKLYRRPPVTFQTPPAIRPSLEPHKLEMRAKVQDLSKASARPKWQPRLVARGEAAIALPDIGKMVDANASKAISKAARDFSPIG